MKVWVVWSSTLIYSVFLFEKEARKFLDNSFLTGSIYITEIEVS